MITKDNKPSKDTVPPLLKVREVAKFLSISRATVHALIECGDLKASRVGPSAKTQRHHVRVERDSLCAFYKKRFGRELDRALANPFSS
jgi:excisionase family DNA binding protein